MNANFFNYLVSYAAFVDTITISVKGVRRKRPQYTVRLGKNNPIGGGQSNYARSQHGSCCLTGNPFELRYGRFHAYRRFVPTYHVVIRSESTPINQWSSSKTLDALFRRGYKAWPSQLELTFDTHIPLEFLLKHACCKPKPRKFESAMYFGSPASSWEVRAYPKAPSVTRLEFVLRRKLLSSRGMETLRSLRNIMQLDPFAWFPLRELRTRSTNCHRHHKRARSMRALQKYCAAKALPFFAITKRCPEERTLR